MTEDNPSEASLQLPTNTQQIAVHFSEENRQKALQLITGWLQETDLATTIAVMYLANMELFTVLLHQSGPYPDKIIEALKGMAKTLNTHVKEHEECCRRISKERYGQEQSPEAPKAPSKTYGVH